MDRGYCPGSWLDTSQALDLLRELTGLPLDSRQLLTLCQAELCRAYLDCSFAHGLVDAEQMFVRRIRGIGLCQLLDGGEQSEVDDAHTLTAGGTVIVRGGVWVYTAEQAHASREEGIWRMNLGGQRRQLYFRPADLQDLVERIREGEQRLQARRASA